MNFFSQELFFPVGKTRFMNLLDSINFLSFFVLTLKNHRKLPFSKFSPFDVFLFKTQIASFLFETFYPIQNCFLIFMIKIPMSYFFTFMRNTETIAVGCLVLLNLFDIKSLEWNYIRRNSLLSVTINEKSVIS